METQLNCASAVWFLNGGLCENCLSCRKDTFLPPRLSDALERGFFNLGKHIACVVEQAMRYC